MLIIRILQISNSCRALPPPRSGWFLYTLVFSPQQTSKLVCIRLTKNVHVVGKVGQRIVGGISRKFQKAAEHTMQALLTETEDVFHTDTVLRVLSVDSLLPLADFRVFGVPLDYPVFHIVLAHKSFYTFSDVCAVGI